MSGRRGARHRGVPGPAVRTEEHPETRLRCPERADGHADHQQGEEADQVAGPAGDDDGHVSATGELGW